MKKDMVFPDREFLRFLPRVLRARDFRLYLEGGKRLVDLWLQGGRAVLGHKPPMVLREMKNAAERGLFTAFPHPAEGRFLKALGEVFPHHSFRLYLDSGSLHRALEKAGRHEELTIWRPFTEQADELTLVSLPVLPWPLGPELLVLDKSLDTGFPAGDLIPPVLLAPATRALYNLIAAMKAPPHQRYRKIEKAIINSRWQRNGIYLKIKMDLDMDGYKALFLHFLENGFLIPPSSAEPLILPMTMSKGEESKLAVLLSESSL